MYDHILRPRHARLDRTIQFPNLPLGMVERVAADDLLHAPDHESDGNELCECKSS